MAIALGKWANLTLDMTPDEIAVYARNRSAPVFAYISNLNLSLKLNESVLRDFYIVLDLVKLHRKSSILSVPKIGPFGGSELLYKLSEFTQSSDLKPELKFVLKATGVSEAALQTLSLRKIASIESFIERTPELAAGMSPNLARELLGARNRLIKRGIGTCQAALTVQQAPQVDSPLVGEPMAIRMESE
ncbi:MAG: hypothetical protein ACXWQE_00365 [Bdellovibrionales bacterium]